MQTPDIDQRSTEPMSKTRLISASVISGIALILLILHITLPTIVTLDQGTLILLALGALPWLTLFFKTLEVPGFAKVETQERTQGVTENPLPPPRTVQAPLEGSITTNAKKVLATLWRYQRQLFGNDITKRWTFEVNPFAPDYPAYLSGLSELVNRGLVAVSPETHQAMLTNDGIAYVSDNVDITNSTDVYQF